MTTVPYKIEADLYDTGDYSGEGTDITLPVRLGDAALIAERGKDRGRRYFPSVVGQMIVPLANRDKAFSVANVDSIYYIPLQKRHLIRWLMLASEGVILDIGGGGGLEIGEGEVLGIDSGNNIPIWTGNTQRIEQRNPYVQKATLICYGPFKIMAEKSISTVVYPSISVSDALHIICDKCGIPIGKRNIQESSVMLRNWFLFNENALAAAERLKLTEGPNATWVEGRDGSVVFENAESRATLLRSTTVQQTFLDTNNRVSVTDYDNGEDDVIDACIILVEQKDAGILEKIWENGEPIVLTANEVQTREIVNSNGFINAVIPSLVGINAEMTITPSAVLDDGTFTLTYERETTAAIDFDATATDIKDALEGLPNLEPDDLLVVGGPINVAPVIIVFRGPLVKEKEIALITSTSLLNPDPKFATIKGLISQEGIPGVQNAVHTYYKSAATISGTWQFKFGGVLTTALTATATAAQIQSALEALPTIVPGDVSVTGGDLPNDFYIQWQGNFAEQAVPLLEVVSNLTTDEPTANLTIVMSVKGGGPDVTIIGGSVTFSLTETSGGSTELRMEADSSGATLNNLQLRAQAFSVARKHKKTYPENFASLTEAQLANVRTYTPEVWRDISIDVAASRAEAWVAYRGVKRATAVISYRERITDSAPQFLREVSDRIHLVNEQLGEDADFYIEHIKDEWGSKYVTSHYAVEKIVGLPLPSDITPPDVSSENATGISSTGATITWLTDEPATSQVEYGETTAYGSLTTLDESLLTSHSVLITGLDPSTTYHYRVLSKDDAGNETIGEDQTFSTIAGGVVGGMADDGLAHVPTNYNTFVPPAKGSTYLDDFGTTVRKVTDYDDAGASLTQEYAPHSAFNSDNSRLLVLYMDGSGYRVINATTGAIVADPAISSSAEAYWSHSDPEIFYYHVDNKIKSYNWSTNTHSTIATFDGTGGLPNYTGITFSGGDADLSEDGDYIPVIGDERYLGMYSFAANKFTPSPKDFGATDENLLWGRVTADNQMLVRCNTSRTLTGTAETSIGDDMVTMSGGAALSEVTQGAYVTISGQQRYVVEVVDDDKFYVNSPFTVNSSGQTVQYIARMILYDKNMNFIRAIAPFGSHASTGRDVDGSCVMVIEGANDLTPPTGCGSSGIEKIKLADGTKTCIAGWPDFNVTGHLSYDNIKGDFYVQFSGYDGRVQIATGTAMPASVLRSDWNASGVWKKYYNEILLIKIDGSEIRRIAHTRTRMAAFGIGGGIQSYYWFTGRGNKSKVKGSNGYPANLIWASNMGDFRLKTIRGTVSTTAGSKIVNGVGTFFSNGSGDVMIGGRIVIGGETKIVEYMDSADQLHVKTAFAGDHIGVSAQADHPDSGIEAFVAEIDTPLSDLTPPVISSVDSGTPGSTTATITWTTDEAATSQVEWGTTDYYGGGISTFDQSLVTSHSINLTGLPSGTLIHFRVKSKDAAGNIRLSADQTFTTA